MLALIEDGLPGGPPLFDLHTVYRTLYQRLAAKGFPTPEQRGRLTASDIAIARNRAFPAPAGRPSLHASGTSHANLDRERRLLTRMGQFEAAADIVRDYASAGDLNARARLTRQLRRSGRFEDAMDIGH